MDIHSYGEPLDFDCGNDTTWLLTTLTAIGEARLNEERRGGPLLAAFGDYCWRTGRAATTELFELWLADVHAGAVPDRAAVDKARAALEATQ